MAEEDVPLKEESGGFDKAKEVLKKIPKPTIFLTIITIIFFIYLIGITYPIPNWNNSTNKYVITPINWTGDTEALKHIEVPADYLKPWHAMLGTALVLLIIFTFLREKQYGGVIGIRKARHLLEQDIRYQQANKMNPDINGKIGWGSYHLKHTDKEGVITYTEYDVGFDIEHQNGLRNYFVGQIHPYTGEHLGIQGKNTPFSHPDICGNCGIMFSNTRIITEQRLRDAWRIKGFGPRRIM